MTLYRYNIDIVIPTYQKAKMLERCIESLSSIHLPRNIVNIWVIENGGKCGVDQIVKKYMHLLPLKYEYCETGNSSLARNRGIELSDSDVVIFFDNDMLFCPDTLTAYATAFEEYGDRFFYGGSLEADYVVQPEAWLIRFLPFSARGFDLGSKIVEIKEPLFLGGNMAIFRNHLQEFGAFDQQGTTGHNSGAIGEETRLQERLLSKNIFGLYVPKAKVLHYVPSENCSKNWILKRCRRSGHMQALEESKVITNRTLFGIPYFRIILFLHLTGQLVACFLTRKSQETRFAVLYEFHKQLGMLSGFIKAQSRAVAPKN